MENLGQKTPKEKYLKKKGNKAMKRKQKLRFFFLNFKKEKEKIS